MVETIAIRSLGAGDSVEELTGLLHHAYAELWHMGLNYMATDQTSEVTRKRNALGECLVAVEDDRLVGTILLNRTIPNFLGERLGRPLIASIHQFAVAPRLQKRGIGSMLLAEAELRAREAGFLELALDTAAPAEHLLFFYRRRGYRDVGSVQWDGKTYSSIILTKRLDNAG